MKTFDDLEFKEHQAIPYFDQQARMDFDNGYGISVVTGINAYCDENTYEVAIMYQGKLTYSTHITDDVLSYQTEQDITEVMRQIQELPKP